MLMRFDPFRDLDRFTQGLLGSEGRRLVALPVDAYRVGDEFVMELEVPGVDPSSVDLTVEKNVLTVKVDRQHTWPSDAEVFVSERAEGSVTRQFFLGDTLDPTGIKASCDNGVLRVSIPTAEQAKARKVEIGANGGQAEAIEASASS
jgi:HSP20 family protein